MDCLKFKQTKLLCEIDGHWGSCGGFMRYSPYRNGVGTAIGILTYEMNEDSEQAGNQYEYYACAECLRDEMDSDDEEKDGHHFIEVKYINGNDEISVAKIINENEVKFHNWHKRNPVTKKSKKRLDKYFSIKESNDWKKTYDDIFVHGKYD